MLHSIFFLQELPKYSEQCRVDYSLPTQVKYYALLHYLVELEGTDYPDWMNETMELLKETLPRLNETVSLQYAVISIARCIYNNRQLSPSLHLVPIRSVQVLTYFILPFLYATLDYRTLCLWWWGLFWGWHSSWAWLMPWGRCASILLHGDH